MKYSASAIFCLIFFGIAFSQDSSFVELPKDSIAIDTIPIDTVAMDTVAIDTVSADSVKIKPGLHYFISVGAQFINFNDRARFQAHLDAELDENDVMFKQDFQTVNLAFPIAIGLMWHFNDWHSLGLGTGFLYNNESVILTDENGEVYNFRYALKAFPIFAEYRLLISPDLISLRDGDYFSLFFRYYWMLPGTELYSSWGTARADLDVFGNGYGIFLGYRFWEWEGLSVWGEIGFLSLDVKSGNKEFMPNSWNLGGISILIRAMF